jgi:3-hydroxybutyryl-CoA dehydrogenase
MGRGIAQVCAQAELEVWLNDASETALTDGLKRIKADLDKLVDRQKLEAGKRDAILTRLHPAPRLEDVATCDFVVEAAIENVDAKLAIFGELDRRATPDTILASNTSSISLTKIAGATRRPERVIGMHFMNPVPLMRLVEIVRALQTDDATYKATCALAEKLGKVLVTTKDMPGFIVNRMLIPFLNEACFALQEGLGSIHDIDQGAKLGLNHPMGPFELADLIGLDTCLAIMEVLHSGLGDDKYRPCPLLRSYVEAGRLGRKSGRGFYEYQSH